MNFLKKWRLVIATMFLFWSGIFAAWFFHNWQFLLTSGAVLLILFLFMLWGD